MKKLNQGVVEYAFGKYGHFNLPALLNFHGVTLTAFKNMHLADQPHLLTQILVHQIPKLKYPLRNYLQRHPKATGRDVFHYATRGRTLTEMGELQQQLRKWTSGLVTKFRLYQGPNGIKSEIAGSFSWSTFDQYEHELEMWKEAECQNCGHEETFRDDGFGDEMADVLDDFEHVSGPYVRCSECEAVTRLTIEAADTMPDSALGDLGDEEWEDYKDHLGELLLELEADLKAKGHTSPDGLMIVAGNVNWRGQTGHKTVDFSGEEVACGVSVNSDFTISGGEMILPEVGVGWLSCRMSHHDVPMGGSVTITPYWTCELDGETPVVGDEIDRVGDLVKATRELFCGPETWHEFSPGSDFKAVSVDGFSDSVVWLINELELEDDDPIRHFLERLDTEGMRGIVGDASAIRALIDERMAREEAA